MMINRSQAEYIIKVLLCHPTPHIEADPHISKEKLWIKKRYRDVRNAMRDAVSEKSNSCYSVAEIESKTDWLIEHLKSVVK